MHEVYLGLGSNLGNRERHLREAIQLIGEKVGQVSRQSTFIETEPWGYDSQNKFLNAVILCHTDQTPQGVLRLTQQIEQEMGRKDKTKGSDTLLPLAPKAYSDRPIDIDILLYDDLTIDEPDLQIPHPLMRQREFVMKPLQEIMNQRK